MLVHTMQRMTTMHTRILVTATTITTRTLCTRVAHSRTCALNLMCSIHRTLLPTPTTFSANSLRSFSSTPDPYAAGGSGFTPPPPPSTSDASGREASGFVQSAKPQIPLSQIDLAAYQPPLPKHNKYGYEIYTSPALKLVRALKTVSVGTSLFSLASFPAFILFAPDATPMITRVVVSGTALVFGLGSTVALNIFLRSYVARIFAIRSDDVPVDPALTPDEQAAQEYQVTVQRFNFVGAPINNTARHCDYYPLSGRLFNNFRMEEPSKKDPNAPPIKRDLFVHMEAATNELLGHIWNRSTMIPIPSTGPTQPTTAAAKIQALNEATRKRDAARAEILQQRAAEQQLKAQTPAPKANK